MAAFDRLDAGAAIAVLAGLAGLAGDDLVPAGARFEAFLEADLGLGLAREIGQIGPERR